MEQCAQCGRRGDTESIKRCTACQTVRYCSRDCQKLHWTRHKTDCKAARKSKRGENQVEKDTTPTDSPHFENPGVMEAANGAGADGDGGSDPLLTCKRCGLKRPKMNKCGKCGEVTYCSRDCQRGDWAVHKVTCQAVDVITTDGFRQLDERERAEQRARQEMEATVRGLLHLSGVPCDSSLLATALANTGRARLTWQEALSRAQRRFPGKNVTGRLEGLRHDGLFRPNAEDTVAVVEITGLYPHPFRHGRMLEDSVGMTTYILFHCPGDPMPYFRYDQLRAGNFLCYRNAFMHFFLDGSVGFRIDDPSHIHIMEP